MRVVECPGFMSSERDCPEECCGFVAFAEKLFKLFGLVSRWIFVVTKGLVCLVYRQVWQRLCLLGVHIPDLNLNLIFREGRDEDGGTLSREDPFHDLVQAFLGEK